MMPRTVVYKENKPRNPLLRFLGARGWHKKQHLGLWMVVALLVSLVGLVVWLDSQGRLPAWPTPAPAPLPSVRAEDWNDFAHDYQRRFSGRLPPPGLDAWLSYATMNSCNEREFYQAIEDDLAFFRTLIRQEGRNFQWKDITPAGLQQTDNYMEFKLHNHQLTMTASRNYGNNGRQQRQIETLLRWILEPIRVHFPPLHATYFFNLHDGATPAKEFTRRPIFSPCKQTYWTENQNPPTTTTTSQDALPFLSEQPPQAWHHETILHHPDYNDWAAFESRDLMVPWHFGYDPNYSDNSIPDNPHAKPFQQRKESILWRGSTTGSVWGESPRFRLIHQYGGTTGKAYPLKDQTPVLVDFAFVTFLPLQPGQTLAPLSRMAGRVTFREAQEHKYIMDVDGNAFTSRFPSLLRSGSLVFKSTRYREWYTERLRPFVDYIPVNYNLTDLPEKLEWAYQNPDLSDKITRHAKETATRFLRREDMRCYVYRLLLEYQTLFDA